MTVPNIRITQLQGQLGIKAPSSKVVAVIGTSSTGTDNTPQAFTRSRSLRAVFGEGPLCEVASQAIDAHGLTVVACKVTEAADGSYGAIDDAGVTGTCTPTASATVLPFDAYDVRIDIVTGGTIGVAGITYTYSLDGGVTNSAVQTLGTASLIALSAYGVRFDLGAGTLVADDFWTCTTVAPTVAAVGISAALTALGSSSVAWDCCIIVGGITGTDIDSIETAFAALTTAGKYRWFQAQFRVPDSGESEATYQAAVVSGLGGHSTIYGVVYAGSQNFTSPVSKRSLVRSTLYAGAPYVCALDKEIDPAWIQNGPLPSTSLRDADGNLLHHDEAETPGLDDLRTTTLRTWDGYTGVYFNNCRIMSAAGSDFEYVQHRRVMNAALYVTRGNLLARLSSPIRANATTGFILEIDRLEIQNQLTSALRRELMAKPMVSDVYAVVSADNDLLDGDALEVEVRIVPLIYPKEIAVTTSYINPAVVAVAV